MFPPGKRARQDAAPTEAGKMQGASLLPLRRERTRGIMNGSQLGKSRNSRELNSLLHPMRYLDNWTNFLYLGVDYATSIAVIVPTIAFCHLRSQWGVHWLWTIPV